MHPHLLRQSIAVHFPRGGADIQHVQDFSGHADKEVRFTAVRAIGRLGGPADIPVLLAMYEQDKDIQPEFSYAEALKNLGEHQVSRQLQAILDARPRWGYARNPRVAIVGHIARSGLRQMPLTIHLERR